MTAKMLNDVIAKGKEKGIIKTKDISDGYHTFEELYYHRMVLTASLFNLNKEVCWKSKQHDDGTMFDGDFIVGIETPEGQATYHYKLEYWDSFNIKELDKAPKYDGHTPADAIDRIKNMFNNKE